MNIEHTIRRYIRLNQKLLVYIVLVVISIVGGLIGIIPGVKRIVALLEENKALEQEVTTLTDKVSFLNTYEVMTLERFSEDVLAAIPGDKSITTLLGTVESLAEKNNLVIIKESMESIGTMSSASASTKQKEKTIGGTNTIGMTVSLVGDLNNLRQFLEQMIHVRRLVQITDFDMSFTGKNYVPEAKMAIQGFYMPLPKNLGKVTDRLETFSQKDSDILGQIASYPIAYTIASASATVTSEPTTPVVADPFNPTGN